MHSGAALESTKQKPCLDIDLSRASVIEGLKIVLSVACSSGQLISRVFKDQAIEQHLGHMLLILAKLVQL
jgi:hypothetical protein